MGLNSSDIAEKQYMDKLSFKNRSKIQRNNARKNQRIDTISNK